MGRGRGPVDPAPHRFFLTAFGRSPVLGKTTRIVDSAPLSSALAELTVIHHWCPEILRLQVIQEVKTNWHQPRNDVHLYSLVRETRQEVSDNRHNLSSVDKEQ
mgnify:CR=1 FL=1